MTLTEKLIAIAIVVFMCVIAAAIGGFIVFVNMHEIVIYLDDEQRDDIEEVNQLHREHAQAYRARTEEHEDDTDHSAADDVRTDAR